MQRVPFGRSHLDPRRANNFLDTCAFDPKYSPEHEAAQRIRALRNGGQVYLLLAHSNQKEVDHPNTPEDVKQESADMIYTIERVSPAVILKPTEWLTIFEETAGA